MSKKIKRWRNWKKRWEIIDESNMKSGNIFGFYPTLHLRIPFWGKMEEAWSAQLISFDEKDKNISFKFIHDGTEYKVLGKAINNYNFSGNILSNGEKCGSVYFTKYINEIGLILWGNWFEDESNYTFIIEIIL